MFTRRFFITTVVASLTMAPTITRAAAPLDYTPGLVDQLLAEGKTVFLDFAADWCSTCKVQERHIASLTAANSAYQENITFVRVDWDDYGRSDLVKRLNVPRRSTLVALKGDQEIGRVVANTSGKVIQNLMDAALAAATA
ncbi:MAG: thioredoxin family protein [Pseudomonadota bacterium]